MKRFIYTIFLTSLFAVSCEKIDTIKTVDEDFKTNFDYFWTLVDEQYCYLDYKNIDWDKVYEEMLPRVEAAKTEQEFFNVLEASLDYLRDGHVWMVSNFKTYSCDTYLYDEQGVKYPANFDSDLIKDFYLKERFLTATGFIYGEIERNGKTFAYIYHPSFEIEFEKIDYEYIEPVIEGADGIIYDIRDNPGGAGAYGLSTASHFFSEKRLVGYHAIKTGKGHSDMSDFKALYVKPNEKHDWTGKKTMLLTNRRVYSTANLFTCAMKHADNVTQIGGKSGGGGAMPMTHYLPNGWLVVFPANMLFDVDKNHIESGIDPDVLVNMTEEDFNAGRDTILEEAIKRLSE